MRSPGECRPTSIVILGYTLAMKTAISLSDETFDRVSRTASDLGMSRSEFFARAAKRYLDELDAQSLTSQINSAMVHLASIFHVVDVPA